jgi:hypothetical protein
MRTELEFKRRGLTHEYICGHVSLCCDGVDEFFEVRDEHGNCVPNIVLVFSDRWLGANSYKIDKSMSAWEYEVLVEDGEVADISWFLPCLDDVDPCLRYHADKKFLELWDEGYNYVRCEISE